ncbi:MAG: glycosyltransferase family 39 protein [Methylococcaceae bacterium]|nr:glycosyltransferase family 39 protein [Methylococcaceae bacterium]
MIAAALVLRLIGLNSDLWYDEVVTLIEYVRLPLSQLLVTYTSPNNHILFSLFAKFCTTLFGESSWALRLPALVAGVASLAALYWVGLIITDARIALLATGLVTVSYHHIWFSQNARGYSGMLLLTLVGTGLFIEGLRQRDTDTKIWLCYALVLALAMYTHLTAVFPFMSHGLIYLVLFASHRIGARYPSFRSLASPFPGAKDYRPLIGFGFGLLIVMHFYAILIPQMFHKFVGRSVQESGPNKVVEWTNPIWTALEILKSLDLSHTSLIALVFGGVLCAVGYLDLLRKKPIVAVLIILNIPITLAVLLLINFHIWPRYFFVNIGFLSLIIVNGAFVIGAFLENRHFLKSRSRLNGRLVGFAITLLVIAGSISTLPKNYRMPKQDFSGARNYIEGLRNIHDKIVSAGITAYPYQKLYAPTWRSVTTISELKNEQKNAKNTWLVYSFPTYMKGVHPELLEYIQNHFELEKEFPGSLGDGTIYVWKSRD